VHAAYIDGLGPATAIRYGELPDPEPAAAQVLVRVAAVAVDPVDTYLRSGRWRTAVTFPLAVGRDLVGTVAGCGSAVPDLRVGEWVWTNSAGYGDRPGATAELVAVDRSRLYRLPEGADPVRFVAAVHPGATAHGVLLDRARLQPGETVAVVGANGAVGACLVQVAARHGAEVVAVVRHAAAAELLYGLGARQVVLAEAADAVPAAAEAAPDGIDVFVDTTGRVDVGTVPDRLNPRGRMVLIAGRGTAEIDRWRFYVREIQLLGFVMSQMTVPELAAAAEWINAAHRDRPLAVGVGQVLRFADAARAHAVVESGELPRMPDGTVGRLVLRP
jgi:NADPH:quinone reductase-like Zn-dependent oxidoreductase